MHHAMHAPLPILKVYTSCCSIDPPVILKFQGDFTFIACNLCSAVIQDNSERSEVLIRFNWDFGGGGGGGHGGGGPWTLLD